VGSFDEPPLLRIREMKRFVKNQQRDSSSQACLAQRPFLPKVYRIGA
jgi:hypothetical protein